jgi:hypothetical protein
LWVVGCGLWVVGCGLWVVGCGLVGTIIMMLLLLFMGAVRKQISLSSAVNSTASCNGTARTRCQQRV